jgi:uncharacterized protein
MKKVLTIVFLVFLLTIGIGYGLAIPNYVGYVNDFANVLKPSERSELENRLTAIEQDTTDEIAIVTTNDLQNETIEMYSVYLFQKWGIGKKGEDNGLLILLVPSTRQYRFEVGYGLEGVLNDAKVGQIGRDCFKTYFANASYYEGFNCALDRISYEISLSNETSTNTTPTTQDIWVYVIIIVVIVVLIIITRGRIIPFLFDIVGKVFGFGGGRSGGGGAGGDY